MFGRLSPGQLLYIPDIAAQRSGILRRAASGNVHDLSYAGINTGTKHGGGGGGCVFAAPDSSSSRFPLLRVTLTRPVVVLKLVMASVMGSFLLR